MGTIAARDALRVLQLTEQVAAALLITVRQGLALRSRQRPEGAPPMSLRLQQFFGELEQVIPFIEEDVALEPLLRELLSRIDDQQWRLYENTDG